MNPPRVYMSSQTWTFLPPPTQHHPSGSSPCTSPKHPASCIEHRLAIRFLHDSIHVSMPFSQITPPSSSPSEYKSPLYTSVSLLLSCIQGHHYHLSKFHIYVLVYSPVDFWKVAKESQWRMNSVKWMMFEQLDIHLKSWSVLHTFPKWNELHIQRCNIKLLNIKIKHRSKLTSMTLGYTKRSPKLQNNNKKR